MRMGQLSDVRCGRAFFGLLAFLLLAQPAPATADVGSPFGQLDGVWTGTGVLGFADGREEAITCRVQFVQIVADNLQMALRCTTLGRAFQINAIFLNRDGTVRGRWHEVENNISGRLSGAVDGNEISGELSALGRTGHMVLVTTGDTQTVALWTEELDVRRLDIVMQRGGR